MVRTTVLAILLTIVASSASVDPQPVSVPLLTDVSGFFSNSNEDQSFDDMSALQKLMSNTSQPALPVLEGVYSISYMQLISPADTLFVSTSLMKDRIESEFGILDLSWQNITGNQLALLLQDRQMGGQPVTSLRLSNSRIHGLTMDSFKPVETTLQELYMDNCSVPLNALCRLSNLKTLNLSNMGLSTFEWYPQLRDSLEELDLSHNKLYEIRPELSVLTSLRRLYLSHNRISSVKKFPLAKMPNLEVLSLTMNSLRDATFTSLKSLQLLELDWNYLWSASVNLHLPSHRMALRLASNPWRCDCGLLYVRDNYDVLDIDQLQCANRGSYDICDDCKRQFNPRENGLQVEHLTKDSIEHLGCTGLTDQFYLLRNALIKLRDHEPEKLVRLGVILVTSVFLLIAAVLVCKQSCSKKKFDRQSWLTIQQIPYLRINKLAKPQEVPYVKIDTPYFKE